eukprot:scaffold486_cov254-Pinguiococcus_pyrenoidosus.AAC.5
MQERSCQRVWHAHARSPALQQRVAGGGRDLSVCYAQRKAQAEAEAALAFVQALADFHHNGVLADHDRHAESYKVLRRQGRTGLLGEDPLVVHPHGHAAVSHGLHGDQVVLDSREERPGVHKIIAGSAGGAAGIAVVLREVHRVAEDRALTSGAAGKF